MKATTMLAASAIVLCACGSSPAPAAARATGASAIHHILLEVSDLDRSIAFYRDRLGLDVTSRNDGFATLQCGQVGLFLWNKHWDWEPADARAARKGVGMYPHFVVADVKAATAALARAGATIVQQPRDYDWGTEAFVADPDGYVWALVRMK